MCKFNQKTFCAVLVAVLLVFSMFSASCLAAVASIGVSKPLADGWAVVGVMNQGVLQQTSVSIKATDTAEQKRDKIAQALRNNGYTVTTSGSTSIIISDLAEGTSVLFTSASTGENFNYMEAIDLNRILDGLIEFLGTFSPSEPNGQPSVFSAGVGNDRGEYTVALKSDSIADLSATGVALALYNRLSTNLPEGISLTLVGPAMKVKFDPDFTKITGAKLVFGTTSALGGVGCSLGPTLPPIPTVSQCGLIAMAGLLVTVGAIVIVRHRRRVAA